MLNISTVIDFTGRESVARIRYVAIKIRKCQMLLHYLSRRPNHFF
jgi:hypothetical protein